jgi:hypothetical protein
LSLIKFIFKWLEKEAKAAKEVKEEKWARPSDPLSLNQLEPAYNSLSEEFIDSSKPECPHTTESDLPLQSTQLLSWNI